MAWLLSGHSQPQQSPRHPGPYSGGASVTMSPAMPGQATATLKQQLQQPPSTNQEMWPMPPLSMRHAQQQPPSDTTEWSQRGPAQPLQDRRLYAAGGSTNLPNGGSGVAPPSLTMPSAPSRGAPPVLAPAMSPGPLSPRMHPGSWSPHAGLGPGPGSPAVPPNRRMSPPAVQPSSGSAVPPNVEMWPPPCLMERQSLPMRPPAMSGGVNPIIANTAAAAAAAAGAGMTHPSYVSAASPGTTPRASSPDAAVQAILATAKRRSSSFEPPPPALPSMEALSHHSSLTQRQPSWMPGLVSSETQTSELARPWEAELRQLREELEAERRLRQQDKAEEAAAMEWLSELNKSGVQELEQCQRELQKEKTLREELEVVASQEAAAAEERIEVLKEAPLSERDETIAELQERLEEFSEEVSRLQARRRSMSIGLDEEEEESEEEYYTSTAAALEAAKRTLSLFKTELKDSHERELALTEAMSTESGSFAASLAAAETRTEAYWQEQFKAELAARDAETDRQVRQVWDAAHEAEMSAAAAREEHQGALRSSETGAVRAACEAAVAEQASELAHAREELKAQAEVEERLRRELDSFERRATKELAELQAALASATAAAASAEAAAASAEAAKVAAESQGGSPTATPATTAEPSTFSFCRSADDGPPADDEEETATEPSRATLVESGVQTDEVAPPSLVARARKSTALTDSDGRSMRTTTEESAGGSESQGARPRGKSAHFAEENSNPFTSKRRSSLRSVPDVNGMRNRKSATFAVEDEAESVEFSLKNLEDSWDSDWLMNLVKELFEECDESKTGHLFWDRGECRSFIVKFFGKFSMQVPELPLVVWRQMYNDVKTETEDYATEGLNLHECFLYARRVFQLMKNFHPEMKLQKQQRRKSRLHTDGIDMSEVTISDYGGRPSPRPSLRSPRNNVTSKASTPRGSASGGTTTPRTSVFGTRSSAGRPSVPNIPSGGQISPRQSMT
eukprot:TRINITY_DN7906_c0_g1_i1.p1 TRINITY_DN7906_c0_g1~~TRINITY_DN7906_c0_g1_i1.p1  ORF type:complete len:974 (+),score=285.86 TRINITY_DN7906_c0_g1_i1:97-3018(+)